MHHRYDLTNQQLQGLVESWSLFVWVANEGPVCPDVQSPAHCGMCSNDCWCYFAEPITECDVEQWNKDFMQRSEELYDAMMNCHWEPLDSVDSPIPPLS